MRQADVPTNLTRSSWPRQKICSSTTKDRLVCGSLKSRTPVSMYQFDPIWILYEKQLKLPTHRFFCFFSIMERIRKGSAEKKWGSPSIQYTVQTTKNDNLPSSEQSSLLTDLVILEKKGEKQLSKSVRSFRLLTRVQNVSKNRAQNNFLNGGRSCWPAKAILARPCLVFDRSKYWNYLFWRISPLSQKYRLIGTKRCC